MVTPNILELLATLHAAGVRVNLLNNYDPATHTDKANESRQTVRFEQDKPYYKLPKYDVSSAGNLNINFTLKGKAVDIVHHKSYEAVNFKCISIVKNQQLFKDSLDICPEDADIVRELGFEVEDDNTIDLSKFSLTDGIDVSEYKFADALVERYIFEAFKDRTPKPKMDWSTPFSYEEKLLLENGYNARTKVWNPIITKVTNRVGNNKTDYIGYGYINGNKGIPYIANVLKIEPAKRTLTARRIFELWETGYRPEDVELKVNTYKYALLIKNHKMTTDRYPIKRNDIEFLVSFYK